MITSIQLGNIFTQNDRQIISGGQSGFDIEGLVKGLTEARRQPAVILEKNIEKNQKTTEELGKMRDILTRFRDSANFLRNPPGVLNDADNVFKYRNVSLQSSNGVDADTYVNVVAEPGAQLTDYSLTINQLATRSIYTTNSMSIANADTAIVGVAGGNILQTGTLTLGGVNITLENGDTLNEVVAKVNASSQQSGVEAVSIRVANGEYRLSLRSLETGTAKELNLAPPNPLAFMQNNAIFRMDAYDINGNRNYGDNPTTSQSQPSITDPQGLTTTTLQGTAPVFLPNGATNGAATIDFTNGAYRPTGNNQIHNQTFTQKGFLFSFKTGANVSGTQVIYEQGNGTRGFNIHIAADPGNGNQPTLFAVANDTAWGGANTTKVLNLGVVTANTDYNVALNFDATNNPATVSTTNTFTGYVNGTQAAQVNNLAQMTAQVATHGIGGANAGLRLATGASVGTTGLYFQGNINEMALFNRTLTATEITQSDEYFDLKYTQSLPSAGIFSNIGFATTQRAQDAVITLDGNTITRSSNTISDVVDGISLTLKQATPAGTTINAEVQPDVDLAVDGILNFVDAYNEFRLFRSGQREVGANGRPVETAILNRSNSLSQTDSRINAEMTALVNGLGNLDPKRLSDIGITLSDFPGNDEVPFTRNILVVDEAKLRNALTSDYDAVARVFGFDYSSDDPNLQIFQRTNALNVTEFSLNIDQTNGIFQATYTNVSGAVVTVDLEVTANVLEGVTLRGKAGTDLEGLVMIYGSDDDSVVNVKVSQGIADRIHNTLAEVLNEDTGVVALELRSISQQNERWQQNITRIDDQITRYRDQLLEQYSALEAAISQANTLLQTLDAQANARANQ